MGSQERLPGREHIPRYPRGWIVLRCFQLVFCILIIGLSAYSLVVLPAIGPILAMVTALITLGVSIWLICAHSCAPKSYNYWAVLVLDIFLYIFWLVSFALCAVDAAALLVLNIGYCSDYYDYYNDDSYYNDYCSNDSTAGVLGAVVAAMAGLGALEFLFFKISWITDAIVIHRHRRAGLHNKPISGVGAGVPGSAARPYQIQMHPQAKPNYEAVPQQGMPFQQEDTSYNPHGMYSPPAQGFPQQQPPPQPYYQNGHHSFYQPGTAPIVPQPTGSSMHSAATPPPQGGYQPPYQHQQSPHQYQPYAQPAPGPAHSPAPDHPPQHGN